MTIQQLEYLLEVNRSKSITTAAKKLYITQGSLSKAISTLEKELGFPIFSRTRNGVVPTDRGLEVLEYAGRICADHRAMLEGKKNQAQGSAAQSSSLQAVSRGVSSADGGI